MRRVTDAHDSDRPHVLLVSYWYPPQVGAAAERIAAFARHLPASGWNVTVLTALRGDHNATPPATDDEHVKIHRVRDPLAGAQPAFADYDPRRRPSRWRGWLRSFVFPDRFRRWQRQAYQTSVNILRRRPPDVILASFPPASAAVLGMRLADAGRVPLVVDFRDNWIGPGGYRPRTARARAAHESLAREVIGAARGLTAVSDTMADALRTAYDLSADCVAAIPNGYEPDALGDIHIDERHHHAFELVHVGTVIPRNRPDVFFHTLDALRRAGRLDHVGFRFVGNLSRGFLSDTGLDSIVATTGLVPRADALRETLHAPALLLLVGDYVGRWGHNAKVFEYIASGRPVVCLEETPGANDRRLLERFAPERSFFAKLGDADGLVAAVEQARATAADRAFGPIMPPGFERYTRAALTDQLARFIAACR